MIYLKMVLLVCALVSVPLLAVQGNLPGTLWALTALILTVNGCIIEGDFH